MWFGESTGYLAGDETLNPSPSANMPKIKFTSLAVFIIFFGIALLEAFKNRNWVAATLFLALGAPSLWADLRKDKKE